MICSTLDRFAYRAYRVLFLLNEGNHYYENYCTEISELWESLILPNRVVVLEGSKFFRPGLLARLSWRGPFLAAESHWDSAVRCRCRWHPPNASLGEDNGASRKHLRAPSIPSTPAGHHAGMLSRASFTKDSHGLPITYQDIHSARLLIQLCWTI